MVRISSTQPRKQRKARYNAKLHQLGKFLNAPLSSELRETYGRRSFRIVEGDTVKVTRGDFRGDEGIIDGVDLEKGTVLVHGVTSTKVDGTEVPRPVYASNVQIVKLNLNDKIRQERLEAKK
ncbi:50S ribosomal protein L24 [Methanoplanus limicola]|jgi:large subunit ribosomal protein L24|uniref:Large ribosomal subunit protein uL24 n=1 Tax=Methanoplanus limicola DSM 2279 TaxID=937775 RepID=H1YWQ5_9EURY|nr:50S ribosomal protein L24 [Methanoplanus limicola]EHQ36796.1 ribosomal protein L24 [Methanoplanus limicola DSM 2279]